MGGPPLVLIEWEDSARPIPEWLWLEDWQQGEIVRCASVGWLIEDGDVKALAPNTGDVGPDGPAQVSGVIRIPARAVVRMVRLEEQP